MRRRISWLVAATTSAVVLAFVIPLCLLVRTVAEDRALAAGNDESQGIAILIAGLNDDPNRLGRLVHEVDAQSPAETSVLMPDGTVIGTPDPDLAADLAVLEARGGTATSTHETEGWEFLTPVVTEDGTAVVRTMVPDSLMRAGVYRAWVRISLLGLVLLTVSVLIALRLGRRISNPVTELATVAEQLHLGDLDARATPQGPPETVELAETLNRLADRITELLAAERATVGDLSHRLRTPVTALRLDTEAVDDEDLAARLQDHIGQLQRTIDAIVRDARRPLRNTLGTSCDATSVVHDRGAFWSALAEDQGRPVDVSLPAHPVIVAVDAADLTDLLDVLVDNVFAHTSEETAFSITLVDSEREAVLEIADRGPGLGSADSPTDDEGRRPGTSGLGLQIVRRTAARVGGALTLADNQPGLVARVTLPRSAPDQRRHSHGG
jgi:signal transduction histidine kinase